MPRVLGSQRSSIVTNFLKGIKGKSTKRKWKDSDVESVTYFLVVLYHFVQSVSHASHPPFDVTKFDTCHGSRRGFYELILQVTKMTKNLNFAPAVFCKDLGVVLGFYIVVIMMTPKIHRIVQRIRSPFSFSDTKLFCLISTRCTSTRRTRRRGLL